ncbi:MAG: hypothetical protein ACHQ7M_10555 [Chloroflexota bacterium]
MRLQHGKHPAKGEIPLETRPATAFIFIRWFRQAEPPMVAQSKSPASSAGTAVVLLWV